jgi:hypothetical protein
MDSGVLANAFRVYNIAYAGVSKNNPTSCYLKVPKDIAAIVDLAVVTGVYQKEVYSYETLSKNVPKEFNIPKCYAVYHDKTDPGCKEFCLVMEDWCEPTYLAFDQTSASMSMVDLGSIMETLAAFHAAHWDLPVDDSVLGMGPYKAPADDIVVAMFGGAWEVVKREWSNVFSTPFTRPGNKIDVYVAQIGDILAGPQGAKFFTKLQDDLRTRPRTLTHGDSRGDNIFKVHGDQIGLIDW